MLFKLNKSSSHKPEQISRSYHRLMLQLKTWETNHYTPDLMKNILGLWILKQGMFKYSTMIL